MHFPIRLSSRHSGAARGAEPGTQEHGSPPPCALPDQNRRNLCSWVPAFAGMTDGV
jgi:hypothetical protein